MADELQPLRDVFSQDGEPDDRAWELLNAGLSNAIGEESSASVRPHRTHHSLRLRHSLIATVAVAAALVASLVTFLDHSTNSPVTSAAPWRLASLVAIQPFVANSGSIEFADHATCPAALDCFIVARPLSNSAKNNVYATTNGGGSWRQLSLPQSVFANTALSCTSTMDCVAGGARLDPVTGDIAANKPMTDPVLLSTSSGGASWTVKAVPAPILTLDGELLPSIFNQINCPTTLTCLATLSAYFSSPGAHNAALDNVFMRTDDGGQTWTTTNFPDRVGSVSDSSAVRIGGGPMMEPASLSCPTTQICVAISNSHSRGSQASIVWRTVDGGTTWSVSSLGGDRLWSGGGVISCPDEEHCWVTSVSPESLSSGQVLESDDGGGTWGVRTPVGLPGKTYWASVSCPTDNDCWIAGGSNQSNPIGIVYVSHDGGDSWLNVPLPTAIGPKSEPLASIDEVDCNSTLFCVALGAPAGVSLAGVDEAVLTNS